MSMIERILSSLKLPAYCTPHIGEPKSLSEVNQSQFCRPLLFPNSESQGRNQCQWRLGKRSARMATAPLLFLKNTTRLSKR